MKIKKIDLSGLRHNEHFRFHAEGISLVEKYKPEAIGLDFLYPDYLECLKKEKLVLKRVGKSEIIEAISSADAKQKALFTGFWEAVKAGEKHYDHSIRGAAESIRFAIEKYNGIEDKTYDEEAMALNLLIGELYNRYLPEITIMKMEGWLDELRRINRELEKCVNKFFSEGMGKISVSIKKARRGTDETYFKMTEWIEALATINGELAYAGFMHELNVKNERYCQMLMRRSMLNGGTLKRRANDLMQI